MGARSAMWNRMYRGEPAWELHAPDPELLAALDTRALPAGRALDIGCGTGDNAIELARRGFDVTAIDISELALERARSKADAADVDVTFHRADITALDGVTGPFDLLVDRGLLMSLFGERARRSYTAAVTGLASEGAAMYQYQWELPAVPRPPSRAWLVVRIRGVVLAPGELAERLDDAFSIEVLRRSVEPTDDPGIRRLGIPQVAKASYWLSRREVSG